MLTFFRQMGLGKTITCVSLISRTIPSALQFGSSPLDPVTLPGSSTSHAERDDPPALHFAGSVFGMPDLSARGKGKSVKAQDKLEADWARKSRIKVKSRASLVLCPLSTISNWEDQFREHWNGPVTVVGGGGGVCVPVAPASSSSLISMEDDAMDTKPSTATLHPTHPQHRTGQALKVYIYHGNARRPDPNYLADFDVVITTYSTLASEFSKQNKSIAVPEEDGDESSDGFGGVEIDEYGNSTIRLPKAKKNLKRKKPWSGAPNPTACSALQAVHWFRVVLDEAQLVGFPFQLFRLPNHGSAVSKRPTLSAVGLHVN